MAFRWNDIACIRKRVDFCEIARQFDQIVKTARTREVPDAGRAALSVDLSDKIDKRAKFRGHFSVRQPDDVSRARLDFVVQ